MQKLTRLLSIFLFAIVIAISISPISKVHAASGDSYTLNVNGDFNYDSGQEMLAYINEERALNGSAPLELDSQLTDAAMQRAAEIAYYFSHTRPNSYSCFSVCARSSGENIAAGNATAYDTFIQWKNSQGHWENMVRTRFTKIGIGHFKHNGNHFWVQLFADDYTNYPETRTETVSVTVPIEIVELSPLILNQGIFDDGTALELGQNDSYQLNVSAVNSKWTYATCVFNTNSFHWSSSDPSIAKIDENGLITGISHGSVIISGTPKIGKLTPLTLNVTVGDTTVDPTDLTGKTNIRVNTWNKEGYSNWSKMLENEVTVTYKGKELTYGEDYYFNRAVSTNSPYLDYFSITYIGKYSGAELHYSIESAWKYEIADQTYTGQEIKPDIYMHYGAIEGVDYTISYANNTNVGTASVTITGMGYFHGTVTKQFNIVYGNITGVTAKNYSGTYDGKAHTITLSGIPSGAKVTYATSKDGTYSSTKPTRTNAGTTTVYYKITKSNYNTVTGSSTITIKPVDISALKIKLSAEKLAYTGKVQAPGVTVTDKAGKKLTQNTHYTVSYSSGRKQVGKYTVKITLKGNYQGNKTLSFVIVPKAPSSVSAVLYGYNDVKISWKKVSNASGYYVYYKSPTDTSYKRLSATTGTSVKKANLNDGVKYTLKVVPYYKNGKNIYTSLSSKAASVYTLKKVSTPKISKSGSKVKVSWTNIEGETGYQISRSTKKANTSIVSTYKTTSGTSKTLSAKKGKTYYYKVRAYKVVNGKNIYAPWSNVISYKRK